MTLEETTWRFDNRTGKMAPEHQRLLRYPAMDLEEICVVPVSHVGATPLTAGVNPDGVRALQLGLLESKQPYEPR